MFDLLMTRRSIRKYKRKKVETEKIDMIIQAALTSPSGKNKRPWEFILIDNKEILDKLSISRGGASNFISNSSLAIVILGDPNISDTWIEDSSIASNIIQLTAHSLGLGSCWVQVRNRIRDDETSVEDYVIELLGIPDNLSVLSIIAIGYPNENKKPHDKNSLSQDKVHYNKY